MGGIAGLIGFLMRLKLKETPEFLELQKNCKILKAPFFNLVKDYKFVSIIGILTITSVGFVLIFFGDVLPSYLQAELHYSNIQAIDLSLVFILVEVVMLIIVGFISVKITLVSKRFYVYSFIITAFLVLQAVSKIIIFSSWNMLIFYVVIAAFATSITYLLATLHLIELFPAEIRYSGIAATYNIGLGIAEASAPVTFVLAVHQTHSQFAPVYCFMLIFCVGIIAAILISRYKISTNVQSVSVK